MSERASGTETVRDRSRNRRGEGAQLRAEIQAAAAELLAETGDEQAVTLRAVARRVGITAPSIYRHFADRHAILLALAADAFAQLTVELRAATEADPAAALRACCTAYLDFAVTQPQLYKIMFGGVWSATEGVRIGSFAREEATALGQDALQVFVEALAACVAADESTSTNPVADAVALWVGLHGLAHQRALIPDFPWPPDITERLVTALAHLG